MRFLPFFLLCALAGCHDAGADAGDGANDGEIAQARPAETPLRPASPPPRAAEGEWHRDGPRLAYDDAVSGATTMRLSCGSGTLRVSLPGVVPVGSEERLTFGGGGEVETLVVDTRTPSVEAGGVAPPAPRLSALLEAGPGASYGATAIGPLVPVPPELATAFAATCG